MTTTTKPFAPELPPSLPFDIYYPGVTVGPDALLEQSVAHRRLGIEKRLTDHAERNNANPHLSWDGKIARWTEQAAVPALRELNDDGKALRGMELALLQRGQSLVAQQVGRMPKLSDPERVSLVEAFRSASSEAKARAFAAASSGRDPMLARALAESHLLLSGLEEFEMQALRAGMLDHLDEAPALHRERVEIEERLGAVRREALAIENLRKAVIAQSDRSKLPAEVLPRKGEMTQEQASMFMLDFGFEAYKQLLD